MSAPTIQDPSARSSCAVVVLGGNAFQDAGGELTMAGEFSYAHTALGHLEPLVRAGTPLLLSHGNGPQVGHMLIRVERAQGAAYAHPLDVCVADTQGELGYVLARTVRDLVRQWAVAREVACLITQVEVRADDPAFQAPDKPVGPRYDEARARALEAQGYAIRAQPGGGFRRVVPSPVPRAVLELEVIRTLLEAGVLVIAGGGGGVPVRRGAGGLEGVDAVIDKDRTAALMAHQLGADLLAILSPVPCAYTDYATERQAPIGHTTRAQLAELARAGHFAPGSMLPKVEAVLEFTRHPGRRAIICDPPHLGAALAGRAGTLIASDP